MRPRPRNGPRAGPCVCRGRVRRRERLRSVLAAPPLVSPMDLARAVAHWSRAAYPASLRQNHAPQAPAAPGPVPCASATGAGLVLRPRVATALDVTRGRWARRRHDRARIASPAGRGGAPVVNARAAVPRSGSARPTRALTPAEATVA